MMHFASLGPVHGYIYEDRGELVSTFIVCFALSSAVAGYSSGSFYRSYFTTPRAEQNSNWQKTMVCTFVLFPAIVIIVISVLNTIAVYYDTISAIHAMVSCAWEMMSSYRLRDQYSTKFVL